MLCLSSLLSNMFLSKVRIQKKEKREKDIYYIYIMLQHYTCIENNIIIIILYGKRRRRNVTLVTFLPPPLKLGVRCRKNTRPFLVQNKQIQIKIYKSKSKLISNNSYIVAKMRACCDHTTLSNKKRKFHMILNIRFSDISMAFRNSVVNGVIATGAWILFSQTMELGDCFGPCSGVAA